MRKRRAILHIGTEKTGTTSIQASLSAARSALLAQGFAYPTSAGAANHVRLAVFAGLPKLVEGLARDFHVPGGVEGAKAQLPQELAREMLALPGSVHTVVFSNEHCHSRLRTVEDVARLKGLLEPLFDEVRILVYLRRQDELAASHYTTLLRGGATHTDVLAPQGREPPSYFDYAALLDRWGAVFGQAALQPRLYLRELFPEGDVVLDALQACGIARLPVPPGTRARNLSLVAPAQEFLRRSNLAVAEGRSGQRLGLGRVGQVLEARFAGAGRLPSRAAAQAFVAPFAEGNERVRAAWFPERASLFPEGFEEYPEQEPPLPGDAEVLEVAMAVIRDLEAKPPG